MSKRLDPKFEVLPAAQQQIWNVLAAAPRLGFVLYGGTAIALHLGHRRSIDFEFFRICLTEGEVSHEIGGAVSVRLSHAQIA
jgi:hypothetical protein